MEITDYVVILLFLLLGSLLIVATFNKLLPKKIGCEFFAWHYVNDDEKPDFDGVSFKAKCSRCGKEVLQDSQGNWF